MRARFFFLAILLIFVENVSSRGRYRDDEPGIYRDDEPEGKFQKRDNSAATSYKETVDSMLANRKNMNNMNDMDIIKTSTLLNIARARSLGEYINLENIDLPEIDAKPGHSEKFEENDKTVRLYKNPENSMCAPIMVCVALNENEKSSNSLRIVFPQCVTVARCGGCSCTGMGKCKPSKTEIFRIMTVETTKSALDEEISIYKERDIENHIACACSCDETKKNCENDKHEYSELMCKCQCKDRKAYAKCKKEADILGKKMWDYSLCKCMCLPHHTPYACSSGEKVDHEGDCSCQRYPKFRRRPKFSLNSLLRSG